MPTAYSPLLRRERIGAESSNPLRVLACEALQSQCYLYIMLFGKEKYKTRSTHLEQVY